MYQLEVVLLVLVLLLAIILRREQEYSSFLKKIARNESQGIQESWLNENSFLPREQIEPFTQRWCYSLFDMQQNYYGYSQLAVYVLLVVVLL